MKIVIDTRPTSGYDDSPGRCHFPIKNYLEFARAAHGDGVLYRALSWRAAGPPMRHRPVKRQSIQTPSPPRTATPQ